MHRRLLFKPVIFQRMTWLAMCLLVTSCGLAQEPVQEPTVLRWPEGLITAIQANDLPAVKESLEKGAEVNARNNGGSTPLMIAAGFSSTPEIVSLLVEKGAEVEARTNFGWTPLIFSAGSSTTPEIVTLLLEKGAEVEARDTDGWTPLMIAARFSSTSEIVTVLLEKGADALAKSKAGKKAIDYAEENDKLKGTKAYWKLHDQSFE
jgi:ankyrin repeat protein